MEFETQQKREQKRAEQKLIAHLLAGVADILKSPGAKDLVFSLSKKVTEVICERRLLIEHSFILLSLLEDLSAWSVGLKDIDMFKGELELKAVDMKVGTMPDFIDPYKVADEIILLSKLKSQQPGLNPILPPSPPPDGPAEKDDKSMSISARRNLSSTLPLTITFANNGSRSRNQSLSSSYDLLTPGSSSCGDDSSMETKCKCTKDGDDDTVTHKGLEQEEQYPLPAWLNINTFCEEFEQIAQQEGCLITFKKVTDGSANSQCLIIHSERGWNIRRCKGKLNEYMEKIKVNIAREEDSAKLVDPANRIEYDRNKLLSIRDTVKRDSSLYCPQNLTDRARYFGVYVENR